MAAKLSADESIALINQNLQEVLKPEIIEDVIKKQNRPLIIYWGMTVPSPISSQSLRLGKPCTRELAQYFFN